MNDSIKPTSDFFGMSHTGDSYPPAPSLPSPVMVQKKIEARPLPLRSRAGAVESEGKHAWAQRGRSRALCVEGLKKNGLFLSRSLLGQEEAQRHVRQKRRGGRQSLAV